MLIKLRNIVSRVGRGITKLVERQNLDFENLRHLPDLQEWRTKVVSKMKKIIQKTKRTDNGDNELQNRDSQIHRVTGLPRALLGYLGKIALSNGDEDVKPGSRRAKNRIRGRIAYK